MHLRSDKATYVLSILAPAVWVDRCGRVYLHLATEGKGSALVGPKTGRVRELFKVATPDGYTPVTHDPQRLAERWLQTDAKHYIPLTERGKRIIMAIIAINKRGEKGAEFIGRFNDVMAAIVATPAGGEVFDTCSNDLEEYFTISDLCEIYNMIADKPVAKFKDKLTAIARVKAAAEGVASTVIQTEGTTPSAPSDNNVTEATASATVSPVASTRCLKKYEVVPGVDFSKRRGGYRATLDAVVALGKANAHELHAHVCANFKADYKFSDIYADLNVGRKQGYVREVMDEQ